MSSIVCTRPKQSYYIFYGRIYHVWHCLPLWNEIQQYIYICLLLLWNMTWMEHQQDIENHLFELTFFKKGSLSFVSYPAGSYITFQDVQRQFQRDMVITIGNYSSVKQTVNFTAVTIHRLFGLKILYLWWRIIYIFKMYIYIIYKISKTYLHKITLRVRFEFFFLLLYLTIKKWKHILF